MLLDVVGGETAGRVDPTTIALDVDQYLPDQFAREAATLHALVDLGVHEGADALVVAVDHQAAHLAVDVQFVPVLLGALDDTQVAGGVLDGCCGRHVPQCASGSSLTSRNPTPYFTLASRVTARDTRGVITLELARALRDAGLRWVPAAGDRFIVVDRGMDSDVFVVADMTVEVHRPPTPGGDTVIGFNGTTEWALDSVDQTDAVWLPAEEQLRTALADAFRRLERRADDDWAVTHAVAGDDRVTTAATPADAYAAALLANLLP